VVLAIFSNNRKNNNPLFMSNKQQPLQVGDTWIDAKDLLVKFEMSQRTLDRWCLKGLAYSKIGRRRLFRYSEIDRFFLAHEIKPRKPKK
jgi:hypothetical protein